MFKRLVFTGLFAFAFCSAGVSLASDFEFSATPDYSYDSYRSPDAYSVERGTSNSLSRHNTTSSSHSFSGNVMFNRSHSRSGYSAQPSGYNPQPANSSTSNYDPQHGSNSAYYRTNTYKY